MSKLSFELTKVGLVGAALQTDALGARLDQEVPHQLVGLVTNWKKNDLEGHKYSPNLGQRFVVSCQN